MNVFLSARICNKQDVVREINNRKQKLFCSRTRKSQSHFVHSKNSDEMVSEAKITCHWILKQVLVCFRLLGLIHPFDT